MARGWCSVHYKRWYRYGDPERPNNNAVGLSPEDKLKHFGWVVTDTGCWEWQGYFSTGGYGQLKINSRETNAHIVSYSVWVGPTNGLHVLHTCDNRKCINPEHLFLGTNKDNVDDRQAKGRTRNGVSGKIVGDAK